MQLLLPFKKSTAQARLFAVLSGLSITALLILVLPTALFAQGPEAPLLPWQNDPFGVMQADAEKRATMAESWLRSSDAVHVAWGAFIVRQQKLDELVPLLLEQIKDYPAVSSSGGSYVEPIDRDRHDAMLVVLDAVIELGKAGDVPVEQAKKLCSEFPADAMILLIHSHDDAQIAALLDVFRISQWTAEWLAAGNVLVPSAHRRCSAIIRHFLLLRRL